MTTSGLEACTEATTAEPTRGRAGWTRPSELASGRTGSIRLEGVSKAFGGVAALSDIDLAVAAGETRAIIGPNGAGKTTLLNLISGIGQPDRGSIVVGPLAGPRLRSDRLARHGIARTFQNLVLFEGLSVAQNIALGRRALRGASAIELATGLGRARSDRAELRAHVAEVVALLDLDEVSDGPIGGLPYGVRKRVELARAVVGRPSILLLDEPLAGIGAGEKEELVRFIRRLRDEFGTTILLIEHDVAVVMQLADRIAVLDHGRKIADGTPADVRRDEAVIAAYLGVNSIQVAA